MADASGLGGRSYRGNELGCKQQKLLGRITAMTSHCAQGVRHYAVSMCWAEARQWRADVVVGDMVVCVCRK